MQHVADRAFVAQTRLLVASLLAVAAFALLVAFVSATAWRLEPDLKLLAALGGAMLNVATGAAVYAAVRLRRAASGVLDEDLPGGEPQDAARAGEDR
jgi:hypothetical protein